MPGLLLRQTSRGNLLAQKGKQINLIWPLLVISLIIFAMNITRRIPTDEGGPEDEFSRHGRELSEPQHGCRCAHHDQQSREAPRYCRLGLPINSSSSSSTASTPGGNASEQAAAAEQGGGGAAGRHKLAVLIPYRDRETHLSTLLSKLSPYLQRQGVSFDIFVLEQGDGYLFNRGALLNAGALLLEGGSYDYYVFQDVDTIPLEEGGIQYAFPSGPSPLHLTPFGIHPKATYEDFFGGIIIFSAEQLRRVNGFGTQFWGWGREDDNMRERLVRAGMWPPQLPDGAQQQQQQQAEGLRGKLTAAASKKHYFQHQEHKQASELRGQEVNGSMVFFEEHPRKPYRGAKIMSSQPDLLQDFATGLNTTQFRIVAVKPFAEAVKYTLELYCNAASTPWCLPSAITQRPGLKRGHAVHAVASGIT